MSLVFNSPVVVKSPAVCKGCKSKISIGRTRIGVKVWGREGKW